MNPYYYLFYKLNCFLNKKGKNGIGPIYLITVLIGWNLAIAYNLILTIDESTYPSYKYSFAVIVIVVYIFNLIILKNKNRRKQIIERYQDETKSSKILGNILVILYVALSVALIFIV